MKLRQVQKTKIERMLDEIEYFLEAMEQQEYMTFDLEKDLRRLSAMLDDVREEIEKWISLQKVLRKYRIFIEKW